MLFRSGKRLGAGRDRDLAGLRERIGREIRESNSSRGDYQISQITTYGQNHYMISCDFDEAHILAES